MAAFQVVDQFADYLGRARNNLATDSFRAALTNVAPTKAGTAVLADISQITAAGGYTTVALANETWVETGAGTGIWQFSSDPFQWTASGANFDSARYVVIYNDTAASKDVVGYTDYGSSFVVTDTNSFVVTPGVNGIFRATVA